MQTTTPMMITRKPKKAGGILDTAKKVVKTVAGAPKAYVDAVGKANARKREYDDNKEIADIERAFGSVENYKKLDPLFRTRKERNSQ